MIKDILKLVIALWIIQKFILDNDLLNEITEKIKAKIKELIK